MQDDEAADGGVLAITKALRRALRNVRDHTAAADLLFLEQWERDPLPGTAAALRVGQIRRANPELVAEIRAELRQDRQPVPRKQATLTA